MKGENSSSSLPINCTLRFTLNHFSQMRQLLRYVMMSSPKPLDAIPARIKKQPYSGFRRRVQQNVLPPTKQWLSPYSTVSSPSLSTPVPIETPRFEDLGSQNIIHPQLLQTIIQDLKFDHMMPVQAATIHELLQNNIDCFGQARTGTGKTVAFLLPAIQNIINSKRHNHAEISALILAPTRELALQIAKEADALLQRFPQYRVRTAIGGTNINKAEKGLLEGCDILVATPGRLLDHMSNPVIPKRLCALQTLVLDEADRMLDMGFLPSIEKILQYLPTKTIVPRQSMLFSATVTGTVLSVSRKILKQDYKLISVIPKGERQTHERVPQFSITVPSFSDAAPAVIAAIKQEFAASPGPFKAIVFAPTARLADFYAHVLADVPKLPSVLVLHSRLTQSRRTKITQEFREASGAICVATDIIARGMDFPSVTHVFQVGMPPEKEDYVHRLGRTGRAGAEGRGILILSEPEKFFFPRLHDLEVQDYPRQLQYSKKDITASLTTLDNKSAIYSAWMGYYKSHLKGFKWSTTDLVRQANTFAFEGLGCTEVPALKKVTIGKMGLKGVPGLRVLKELPTVADSSVK